MASPRDNTTYGFSKPDAEFLVDLVGNGVSLYPENKPRGGGGGGSTCFITPSTGIAAVTGAAGGTMTPGKATCTKYSFNATDETFESTNSTATIYNVSDQNIAGNVLIKATKVQGVYVVDVAGCGTGGQSFQDWRV